MSAPFKLQSLNFYFTETGMAGNARFARTELVNGEYHTDPDTLTTVQAVNPPNTNTLIVPNPEDGSEIRLDANSQDFLDWVAEQYDELSALDPKRVPLTKNKAMRQVMSDEYTDLSGWSIRLVRTIKGDNDWIGLLGNLRRRQATWRPTLR
jgi:hypothetical protein